MRQQLQLVFDVSKLDLKILELQDTLAKIPARRTEIEADLESRRSSLAEKTSRLADCEKTKREKERTVEEAEARLKDFQGKLSSIKTNKEYQAAIKETSGTKKANQLIEDEILRVMTEIDTLRKETQELEASLQAHTTAQEKEKEELQTEEGRLQGLISEMARERNRLLAGIEPQIVARYDRIHKIRREAVSFVEGGSCLGCHMRIPPQLYIEIQKLKSVHTCPSCHRILYMQEWQQEEESLTRPPEADTLSPGGRGS